MAKKKTVMLPLWMKEQADLFAQTACDLDGINSSHPKYKALYKKHHRNFCVEAYTHSLSAPQVSNPSVKKLKNSTPKISEKVFEHFPEIFSDSSKILENTEDPVKKQNLKGAIKAPLTSLTALLCEHLLHLERTRDFEFKKASELDDQKTIWINRYARQYVAILVTEALVPLFTQLNRKLVYDALASLGISSETKWSDLKSSVKHSEFIDKVRKK